MNKYEPVTGDKERKEYVQEFYSEFFSNLVNKRFQPHGIVWTVKKGVSPASMYGVKNEITLKKEDKRLTFTIDVYPWLWSDGEMTIEVEFKKASNLSIPSSRINPKKKTIFMKAKDFDSVDFLTKTEIVGKYIQVINLTWADVNMFDTVLAAVENLL
jgi:uncharacterized protein YneR